MNKYDTQTQSIVSGALAIGSITRTDFNIARRTDEVFMDSETLEQWHQVNDAIDRGVVTIIEDGDLIVDVVLARDEAGQVMRVADAPMCSPSRAAQLTGAHTAETIHDYMRSLTAAIEDAIVPVAFRDLIDGLDLGD